MARIDTADSRVPAKPPALAAVRRALDAQRDALLLWAPVALAAGAAAYLSLEREPVAALVYGPCGFAMALAAVFHRSWWFTPLAFLACIGVGLALGKLRVDLLDTAIIESRTAVVEVRGWIESSAPAGNGQRMVARVAGISDREAARLPRNLRLTVFGADLPLTVGNPVRVRTRLEPVAGPVLPGGFDFARRAWFLGIGGTGLVFGDVLPAEGLGEPPWDIALRVRAERLRRAIATRITDALPEREAGFLVAVTTGRRGNLDDAVVDDLRAAGLAHLLAISGLHMALVAGTAFWAIRALLALVPALALRSAVKKWAAVLALGVACVYLVLSGASVSTQRAFIMIAIMFLAIVVDRPAISIRNVALAALLILCLRPESAVDVSFQMSFMTVTVLVAFYEWRLARRDEADRERDIHRLGLATRLLRRAGFYIGAVVMTTLLAGIATGPISAYHFNTVATYGVLGNLVAVPLMGLIVMPLALAAVFASLLGLEGVFLWGAGQGVSLTLETAHRVAILPGAVQAVAMPPLAAVLAMIAGMLIICLWRGRGRIAGAVVVVAGIATSGLGERPELLVEREAKVAAMRNGNGALALTPGRAGRFASERWLRADGDLGDPAEAAEREGFSCDASACVGRTESGLDVAWLLTPEALWEECRRADVLVARFPLGAGCAGPGVVVDWWDVYRGGAHAVYVRQGRPVAVSAKALRGERPWVAQASERDDADGTEE